MKSATETRIDKLEELVNELLKEAADENLLREKMSDLQLEYTSDKIIRINRVLEALHPYQALELEEAP